MSDLPVMPPAAPLRQRANSAWLRFVDFLTFGGAFGGTMTLIGLLALLIGTILIGAFPSIHQFGFSFFTTSMWNPVTARFGAWPYIYCTLVTSLVALVISLPVSLGSAIFLVKLAPKIRFPIPSALLGKSSPSGWTLLNPRIFVTVTSFLIELLAAIPSIAYGLWGVAVLVPIMQESIQPFLADSVILSDLPLCGWLPHWHVGLYLAHIPGIGILFADPAAGSNMFTSSVVLAIMVTPIMTAIIRDVLAVVPPELEQGALGLGATWWQAMKLVIGFSKMGIFGAVILGFARAMGETMAVTMIIGNSRPSSYSLFSQGQTIASLLANQFNNADTDSERQALYFTALILLMITMLINGIARVILLRVTAGGKHK